MQLLLNNQDVLVMRHRFPIANFCTWHPGIVQQSLEMAARLQVTEETEAMRFNTGIAAMMEFVNGAYKWDTRPRAVLAPFVLLLAAYAPHLGEEMWQVGHLQSAAWAAQRRLQPVPAGGLPRLEQSLPLYCFLRMAA